MYQNKIVTVMDTFIVFVICETDDTTVVSPAYVGCVDTTAMSVVSEIRDTTVGSSSDGRLNHTTRDST